MLTPEQQLQNLTNRVGALENDPGFRFHHHTGIDSNKVTFSDLSNKKIWIRHTLVGANASVAINYGCFFIIPVSAYISVFKEVHETAGVDAGTVTLDLEKLTGTTSPGSGTVIDTAGLSLKSNPNTIQTAKLFTVISTINFSANDRLALKLTGTPTSVAGLTVLVELTVV
jgi:hypothetical protein